MLAINGKVFTQNSTGVGRFAFEVIRSLDFERTPFEILTPNLPIHKEYKELEPFVWRDESAMNPFLWQFIRLPCLLRGKKYSCLWSPANIGPIFSPVPHYLTLHDFTFFHDKNWMPFLPRYFYQVLIPQICKRAEMIFFDCETIHEEYFALNVSNNRNTSWIYLGSDHIPLLEGFSESLAIPQKKYFVVLGNIEKRKNFSRLIRAWEQLAQAPQFDYQLYVIGEKKKRDKRVEDDVHPSIVFLGYVADQEMNHLLAEARGLLFPSLYEGFGFPIVEAFRRGCPVITSNYGTMSEIGGNAAIQVDPNSEREIKDAITRLMGNEALYLELRKKSLDRQRIFAWDNTVRFYQNILFEQRIGSSNGKTSQKEGR
ncbi:glycosyltransferase family 1 protein [Deltaproteobacteria bacterium TL4]